MKSTDILIITPGFPKDENDANCIPSLQLLVQEMSEAEGVQIRVITTQYPFRFGTYYWHGIPVHACGGANRRYHQKLFTYIKALWFMLRFGRKVDVVQGFWLYECGFLAALWGWVTGSLSVVTVQGQDSKPGNGYFGVMRRWSKQKHVRVVSISEFGEKQLLENGGITTDAILPTGIDLRNMPSFESQSPRKWDVMGAGSLVPVKNYSEFLEVIALVQKAIPGLKACIAGGGPQQSDLQKRIAELGLDCELTGEVPRAHVLKRMSETKIFLHTSVWEGQGFVLMECLAMGMYGVASPVGWLPPSPKSFVCPDRQRMADAIVCILTSPSSFEAVPVLTMKETAANYLQFYHTSKNEIQI
jgi:glycosyltransferase involved in cell wall biosynthesis